MAHPREGWQGHGVPRKLTRRSFLGRSAGAALALGSVPLLDACASIASTMSRGLCRSSRVGSPSARAMLSRPAGVL